MKSKLAEITRVNTFDSEHRNNPWHKWGPYLSERSWGTVREDFSEDGNAWAYFPHDLARSKAYRAGEDGLAGISDHFQVLNFSLALWNGKDPFLKERIYGLVPYEGNHGEDVKDYYFYVDSTPSHSYMKYLYKYPQQEFPYQRLVEENQKRSLQDREYELMDTGLFDDHRYFDVFVEYAKADIDDIGIRITVINRGPEEASISLLPQLWFRNRWSWPHSPPNMGTPSIQLQSGGKDFVEAIADDTTVGPDPAFSHDYSLGEYHFYAEGAPEALFTNNETHAEKVYGPKYKSSSPYVKDAFHRYVVDGEQCVNPDHHGTKMAYHYQQIAIAPGDTHTCYLRLSKKQHAAPFKDIKKLFTSRMKEADEFYASIHPKESSIEEQKVQRQAFAGMLWSKQFFMFNVSSWFSHGDIEGMPPPKQKPWIRNTKWKHLDCKQVISMPDKWEYPWFAAWDLAFHTIALSQVDLPFAKEQLWVLLKEDFIHPNGQIPAYEWEFSDLNPPVHAWAIWKVYSREKKLQGQGDRSFLSKCYHKLLMNFCWWVNKVDNSGNNIFEGGFLGLDNISVIDRSEALPSGEQIEQSDGTGWMGLYSLMMMRMALELAYEEEHYQDLAAKFFEHFVLISASLETHDNRRAQMWDEEDGFFYDVVSYPDGHHEPLKVRSQVGLIPLYAVDAITKKDLQAFPHFAKSFHWFCKHRSHLTNCCVTTVNQQHLLSMMRPKQVRSLLKYLWDPEEFRSHYGIRSLSKFHDRYPFTFEGKTVDYEPAEETRPLKGGNSNWRGPIWFPTSYILLDALRQYHSICGEALDIDFQNQTVPLQEIIHTLSCNMVKLFLPDEGGKRPCHGTDHLFQEDPHWKDYVLFYEHFHGDNGRGLGANHQTGWTGLVAKIIEEIHRN